MFLEPLEDRIVLSTIVWANRGAAGDNFDAAFGAGAPADQARAVVDAAIESWSRVVTNFHHAAGVTSPDGYDLSLTISMNLANAGNGASTSTTIGTDGKPIQGSQSFGIADSDGDGLSDGWFIDPTPLESSEFQGNIRNAFTGGAQAGSPAAAAGIRDFYSVVLAELTHNMGIANAGAATALYNTGSFTTDTGVADDGQFGGNGNFFLFQGPDINALMTNHNGGNPGTAVTFPLHSGSPRANNAPIVFAGKTVYGAVDNGNAGGNLNERTLVSNRTALILKDAYGYEITMPETFGTFYASINNSTGLLTVRGGTDNTIINNVNQGASNDVISVTRDGGKIVVSVDAGVDVAGTGPGFNALDQQDAFVSVFDAGQVTGLSIQGFGGNDTITVGADIAVPDTIDPGTGNDVVRTGGGLTTVTSVSGDGNDLINFSNNPAGVNFTVNGGDSIIGTAFADTVTVDSSAGLITSPISFDGGGGFNKLILTQSAGAAQTSDTYSVGPNPGEGSSVITGPGGTQTVFFQNLAPVFDNVPATTVTINATPSDNAINYTQGPGGGIFVGTTGLVTVDNQESYEFNNKDNLVINAGAGSDVINLNNQVRPTGATPGGLKTITVDGGDPTASDTLIVNGIAGQLDNLRYIPTSVGAGNVVNDNAPQPNVTFTETEHLTLVVQQADGDGVRVDGTTGNDAVEYFHGTTSSSGSFVGTMDQNGIGAGPFTMTPMSYSGVSPAANDSDVNFFNPGGTDSFVFNGTASDDTISVGGGEAGGTEFRNTLNGIIASRVEVFNVGSVLVRALAGNDAVNLGIPAGNPATFVRVEGGDSDASTDTLTHTAFGGTTTLNLDLSQIITTGGNPVVYSGFERVNLTNTTGSLTINGYTGDDSINFIPSLAGRGSFTASSTGAFVASYPQFVYAMSAASTITIDSQAGFDTVGLTATAGNDVVNAVQSSTTALSYTQNAFTQLFTIANLEKVKLSTLGGDDLIRVSVSDTLVATPATSLAFDVDGGSPNASDRLIVNDDGLGDLTILRQASDQHSGSASVGTLNPVYYENIERFDITPVNSITGGVGTDGNGRIDVFHTDPFEYNETRLTAATLSRVGESPTGPTIDPGAVVAPFSVPGDEDWYEFRPRATGTFAVKILFDLQGPLANGRPGLPGAGDLNLEIYDANGVIITSGIVAPGGKEAVFGATPTVAQFARIFVRVHGTTPDSINHYEFDNLAEIGTGNPGVGNADLFGPQVTDIQVNSVPSATYNLFNSKDAGNALHPTPLTNSLLISFQDLPLRAPGFGYPSLDPTTATTPGTYVLKGDATGIIAISSIIIEPGTNLPPAVGGLATGQVRLVFAQPLPDDRFTLTINDNLEDPAGNSLDGESNAAEPNGGPSLPSGDGEAGGDFIARFTIDSRVELGTFSAGSVYVDTNGNYLFDPKNTDSTNRDITYLMGFASDNILAGNFVKAPAGVADGFDKLAAYGKVGLNYRWLIDVNNDGVVNGTDVNVVQPLFAGVTSVNGTPVAGNFDGNAANGDEVALKVGTTWLLDKVGHDFKVDTKLPGSNMVGLPIVGDFDGDGIDDLGSWADDKFYLNLSTLGAIDGTADRIFTFGFAGVRERPVAGDFDADGITDLGLWVPDRSGVAPSEAAEWYLLLSGGNTVGTGTSIVTRLAAGGGVINFTPTPFGNDLYAQFGDEFGLPVPGNFDPPLTPTQVAGSFTNSRDPVDVDNDGFVSPIDALLIINKLNSGDTSLASTPFTRAPFVDVNGDGSCAPIDALMVINWLNAHTGSAPSGEGEGEESADAFFSDLGSSSSDDSLSVLLAIDDYQANRKR